jgi:vacuolar-type H+-ATPase subunit H
MVSAALFGPSLAPAAYEREVQVESGGIRNDVQRAIDDLRKAGEKATGDVRAGIDSAVSRLRDVSDEAQGRVREATSGASGRAQEQISSWRSTLEDATEDVRRELAKLAIRAQTSPEALKELEDEAKSRRKELK